MPGVDGDYSGHRASLFSPKVLGTGAFLALLSAVIIPSCSETQLDDTATRDLHIPQSGRRTTVTYEDGSQSVIATSGPQGTNQRREEQIDIIPKGYKFAEPPEKKEKPGFWEGIFGGSNNN